MANDPSLYQRTMETEFELIKNVKENKDENSLKLLIEKHSGIYVEMVNRYIPNTFEGIRKEDILDEKNYRIYDAIINYDETKNTKFSTYLGNITKWKCLNIYNKNLKFPHQSFENIKVKQLNEIACDPGTKELEESESIKKIFKAVNKSKDERVKRIFQLRYSDDKKLVPWKKIAKELDLSIQGCINIHNNYLKEIKKYVQ